MTHRWILIIWLAVAAAHATAEPSRFSAPPTIALDGSEDALLIAPYARILEDAAGSMDFSNVRSATSGWALGRRDALVFGVSESVWWAHFRVHNATQRRLYSMLDLGNPRQDYVNWFILRSDSSVETFASGDRLPFDSRRLPSRSLLLSLTTEPDETVDVYVQLRSADGLFESMPLRLSATVAFIKATNTEELVFTLFVGGLVALALYNLLLLFATREALFGIYVLYLALSTMWSFTFSGFAYEFLWPKNPELNHTVLTITSAWGTAAFGWFVSRYLRMKQTTPRWVYRGYCALIVVNIIVGAIGFVDPFAISTALDHLTGLAVSFATIPISSYLLWRGSREARFFMIAFGLFLLGVLMHRMQIIGVVPTNWFTTWSLQVGAAVESLLLALGLADTFNVLKAKNFAAERRALEAQRALNVELEQQVGERTKALEVANRRLQELTITDELTGAFNRRHFKALTASVLANRTRESGFAFCMFDIDHFKAYNDRYGHQAGDIVLRAVAGAIQGELHRSGDVLFRLGGEEFGIAFDAVSAAAANEFSERLRLCIRALNIQHAGSDKSIVTASFGVGWWSSECMEGLTTESIYAVADRALYLAKGGGRDRVTMASGTADRAALAHVSSSPMPMKSA